MMHCDPNKPKNGRCDDIDVRFFLLLLLVLLLFLFSISSSSSSSSAASSFHLVNQAGT